MTKVGYIKAGLISPHDSAKKIQVDFPFIINSKEEFFSREASLKEYVAECVKKINFGGKSEIDYLNVLYSEAEVVPTSDYDTILEVRIPYTIHIPNGFSVKLSKFDNAKMTFYKIWTKHSKSSDIFDVIGDDIMYYGNHGEVLTPQFPISPEEGWKPTLEGIKNFEVNDGNGYFRYSIIRIELNTRLTEKLLSDNNKIASLQEKILQIINYTLGIYSETTNNFLLKPLSEVVITNIFLPKINYGIYGCKINGSTAIINQSRSVIDEFLGKVRVGHNIPIYKRFQNNAKAYLHYREYKMSIIESFQSLDTFVEYYISKKFDVLGLSLVDFLKEKKKYWSTKFGLSIGLQKAIGLPFSKMNNELYKKWIGNYEIRNTIIHKDVVEFTELEVNNIIKMNENIINTIQKKSPL